MIQTIKTLLMDKIIEKGTFLDLGCGSGKDAIIAMESGFNVTAVDKKLSQELLTTGNSIDFVESKIENFNIETNKYDVIYADNSLPFLQKKDVQKVLETASNNLRPDGILYFSLFGINDAWASDIKMNFWRREEIDQFIKTLGLKLYKKVEEEGFAPQMNGEIKYWHIFRFTLKK